MKPMKYRLLIVNDIIILLRNYIDAPLIFAIPINYIFRRMLKIKPRNFLTQFTTIKTTRDIF
jgi:hypothetical protein